MLKPPRLTRAWLLLGCLPAGVGCAEDPRETQLREVLVQYVRLQGAYISDSATYASAAPPGLAVPPGVEVQVVDASANGHAALAFEAARRDFVCAVRVGAALGNVGAVPSNGQPVCGRREAVVPTRVGDTSTVASAAAGEVAPAPPAPPAYARYFPLIARGAELPLDDPAERAEVVLAITYALTRTADQLEPLTVLDRELRPGAEGGPRPLGDPGAAGWKVVDLRSEARQLVRRLRDATLLPVLMHALITAEDGRGGEFRAFQTALVVLTGVDTAPFYVESTAASRRAMETFWLNWWAAAGPHPLATEQQAIGARLRWERTAQLRAWAADPPSWPEVVRWGVRADLDSVTNDAVRGVVHTLLTDDPSQVAQRMGRPPSAVAEARVRAARYVPVTRDTASIPALIAALTVPDPDLYRDRHDSVFLDLQQTLVAVSGADTAPRYARGSAANREAAAAFWREWWRSSGGRVRFLVSDARRQALRRWGMLGRRSTPSEWLDLLMRSSPAGDEAVARTLRSVAIEIVTLPYDSLARLSAGSRDPRWTARELRERATQRLRPDPRPDVVSALILALERGPAPESPAEVIDHAAVFYLIQESLVRQTRLADAPYFAVPSRAARDSAAAFWRDRWRTDSATWRPPSRWRALASASRWAVDRAVPALREDRSLWVTMLGSLPLGAGEVQQAVRPMVLELLALDQDALERQFSELGSPLSIQLAASLDHGALSFARSYPHDAFVAPLIERLGRRDGAGALANQRFELTQMALVGITGLASAPRYTVARAHALQDAQQYWSAWWSENARGFRAADSATAVRAVSEWLNDRSR